MSSNPAYSIGTTIAAMFLVAGTCIGGGMLALPITTGISGFLPSMAVMFVCWIAMTSSALLLLEATLWMEEGVHLITMSSRLLGTPGKVLSWCLYLFICYASNVGYTAGGGVQMAEALHYYFGISLSMELSCLIFILIFGGIVLAGSAVVGRVGTVLFIGMIISYFAIVGMGAKELDPTLLKRHDWRASLLPLPLLLTSFSFHTMVPSLAPYLKKHAKALRTTIVGGTFIAFLVYAIWQALILGIVPVGGPHGLAESLIQGVPATQFLREHVEGVWIAQIAEFFAYFAIVTSFLGIALGLFDFLADGLGIKKQGWGKVCIGLLLIVPTYFCAVYLERVFIIAFGITGGFGDTILNGIIPVAMVWIGRYRLGYMQAVQLPGGKTALLLVLAFFIFALGLETAAHIGWVPSIYDTHKVLEFMVPELSN